MSDGVFFSRELLKSRAYSELSGATIRVLNYFYMKRQVKKQKGLSGRSNSWKIINNGEIIFTRKEAYKKGFPESTFKKSIDKLISVGFIDLAYQGTGIMHDYNKYSISSRWKLYGTPEFIVKKREKQIRDAKYLIEGRRRTLNNK